MGDILGVVTFVCKNCKQSHIGNLIDGGITVLTVSKVELPSGSEVNAKTFSLSYTCPVNKVEETYDLKVPNNEAGRYEHVELRDVTVVSEKGAHS
jgi:hypothetical protein